jgi:hypothetical protein
MMIPPPWLGSRLAPVGTPDKPLRVFHDIAPAKYQPGAIATGAAKCARKGHRSANDLGRCSRCGGRDK